MPTGRNLPWRYGEYAYGAPTPERDDLIAAIVAAIEEARAAGRREANDASAAHEGGKP